MIRPFLYPLLLTTYLIFLVLGLIWTQDMDQLNEETIFLTKDGRIAYQDFVSGFNVVSMVVATTSTVTKEDTSLLNELTAACNTNCHVHSLEDLNPLRLKTNPGLGFLIVAAEESTKINFKNSIKKMGESFPHLSFSGIPYTNLLLDQYSKTIKKYLFPILFIGIFLILTLFLSTLMEAIICFVPGLMSASLSLSATKIFFSSSNLVTSIVPLLLFVIQLSLVLHIHNTGKELKSLKSALKDKYEPIVLMVITTFIGFGSLAFSSLEAISQFGILSSSLILISTLLTILWLSVVAKVFPEIWFFRRRAKISYKIPMSWSSSWSLKKIALFTVCSLLLGGLALPRIPIITDASRYFPPQLKIKEKMDEIAKHYLGTPILEITLPLTDPNILQLKQIAELEDEIKKKLGVDIISANSLVKLANFKYTGEDKLPPHVLSYFALKGKVPPSINDGYPLEDHYRITILFKNINVDIYEEMLKDIKKIIIGYKYKAHFNGLYYHLMKAQKQMIGVLFKSFFLSLLLISTLSLFYFKSFKVFFIFLAVNIIPVFASFPLLYLFGLSFNIATVMTFSISLGLIVDSSFHIIHALNKPNLTRSYYIFGVVTPVLGASFLLSLCFFLFGLNDFLPIKQFGLCLGIVILWGALLDLKVLPTLYNHKLKPRD